MPQVTAVEVVKAVVVVVGSIIAQRMSRPGRPRAPQQQAEPGLKLNARSTQENIKVVYGTRKVGGNDVFIEGDGDDLWVVQTLSESECDSIAQSGGADQVWLGDKLESQFGSLVSYWFHAGSATQNVDANLNAALPQWTDTLRHTCYIVWKLTFDKNYFQSLPQRTILLKGRKLYDFRDTSTAYSTNPVLALYDYLTSPLYGLGIAASKIDTSSWTAAANYCDTKGWTLNIAVYEDQAAQDVIDAICAHFRGQLVWFDGKYYLRYADLNEESSVMTIDDAHVALDDSGRPQISTGEPSLFDKPAGILVRYADPDLDYALNDIPIGETSGVPDRLVLAGCTDREQAANLGVYALERAALNRGMSGRFRDDCVKLEPHDVVTVNSSALGITGQLMRVDEADILADGTIQLSLVYESTALYNDDYDLIAENEYSCTLADPGAEPPGVGNVSVSEETYNYRLRSFTRLNISFDAPANYPWFDHVEVWLSFDDSTWEHIFDCTSDFELPNVQEGVDYYIRLKVVSIWGGKQADGNDYKIHHPVGGYTDAPDSLATLQAVVNQNTVNLYADKLTDTDVELYEFRLGVSWSGSIFLAALRAPNLSLYGVKPGSHTFIANTLGNNGVYGDTPRSAAVSLLDPPDGWAVQNIETCDYNGVGTHDNTEHYIYDSDDYLKCSHTGGVLTGTYASPIYDRGASARYLTYLLADIVVIGAGTTWDDVIPSPNVWTSIDIATNTWAAIFELPAGPRVTIKLKYGETSPPTNEVERLEILSAIATGRYFQVVITITDPNTEVNALVENFSLKFCQ